MPEDLGDAGAPPIGATAFLIFSMPEVPSAAPRNAVGGQVCGVAAGAVALVAFGASAGAIRRCAGQFRADTHAAQGRCSAGLQAGR
jgi:hypothetical protein